MHSRTDQHTASESLRSVVWVERRPATCGLQGQDQHLCCCRLWLCRGMRRSLCWSLRRLTCGGGCRKGEIWRRVLRRHPAIMYWAAKCLAGQLIVLMVAHGPHVKQRGRQRPWSTGRAEHETAEGLVQVWALAVSWHPAALIRQTLHTPQFQQVCSTADESLVQSATLTSGC